MMLYGRGRQLRWLLAESMAVNAWLAGALALDSGAEPGLGPANFVNACASMTKHTS